jgi:hypothetical protein
MKSTTLQPSANAVENKEAIKANNRITEGLFTLFLDGLKDINRKSLAQNGEKYHFGHADIGTFAAFGNDARAYYSVGIHLLRH